MQRPVIVDKKNQPKRSIFTQPNRPEYQDWEKIYEHTEYGRKLREAQKKANDRARGGGGAGQGN